jgi:hypothetical protein
LLYAFNPYLLLASHVLTPVVSAGMVVVPLLLAWSIAAGRAAKSSGWFWLVTPCFAVLLGFTYVTPPLTGAALVVLACSPVLVWWLYGRAAFTRALRRVAGLAALLLAVSAYWAAPSVVQLATGTIGTSGLSKVALAAYEGRATLANSFWLNTVPLWNTHIYYQFSSAYNALPLSVLRYAPAVLAFGALAAVPWLVSSTTASRRTGARLIVAADCAGLPLIFIATGTRAPGSLLFDFLYHLPLGWLLQPPNRFLYLVALCYAVAVAALLNSLPSSRAVAARIAAFVRRRERPARRLVVASYCAAALALVVALAAPVWPELSGAVIPSHAVSSRSDGPEDRLPSSRVRFPAFWQDMARYLNGSPAEGAVVVLPPHENYLVARTWYYGNTSFIQDMVKRLVLDPATSGGYVAYGSEAEVVPQLLAGAIVSGRAGLASDLLDALGVHYVLVAGDVLANFPGRVITHEFPAQELDTDLERAGAFRLVYRAGPLELFALTRNAAPSQVDGRQVVTTLSASPPLGVLSVLAGHAALVTAAPRPGLADAAFAGVGEMELNGDTLRYKLAVQAGRRYEVVPLFGGQELPGAAKTVSSDGRKAVIGPGVTALVARRGHDVVLDVTVGTTKDVLGAFGSGDWSRVGNCAHGDGDTGLSGLVLLHGGPGGRSAVRLADVRGSACIAQEVKWLPSDGSDMVVSGWVRHISGSPPRLCLWQSALSSCVAAPALPRGRGWSHFEYAVPVSPVGGRVTLFVYGDSARVARGFNEPVPSGHEGTVDEYAGIKISGVSISGIAVIASPKVSALDGRGDVLSTVHTTFDDGWRCSNGFEHVLVDGMMNGCLGPTNGRGGQPAYRGTSFVVGGYVASSAGVGACVAVFGAECLRRRRGRCVNG